MPVESNRYIREKKNSQPAYFLSFLFCARIFGSACPINVSVLETILKTRILMGNLLLSSVEIVLKSVQNEKERRNQTCPICLFSLCLIVSTCKT